MNLSMRRCAKRVTLILSATLVAALGLVLPSGGASWAQDEEKPYRINDGIVDWYTFSGFRRYHAECHVCHGPDGLGSTFAPALTETMKTMSYDDYMEARQCKGAQTGCSKKPTMLSLRSTNASQSCPTRRIWSTWGRP